MEGRGPPVPGEPSGPEAAVPSHLGASGGAFEPQTGSKKGTLSDRSLVGAAQGGDQEAFRRLMGRYARLITVTLYQKLSQRQDVEDLLQEILLKAWRGLPELRNARRFVPWLLRITRNVVTDYIRSQTRLPGTTGHNLNNVPQRSKEGDSTVADEETRCLLEALAELPERYRAVLTLRFMEGLTPQQIAHRLHEPSGTIRNRIFRGLRRLGKLLVRKGFSGPGGPHEQRSQPQREVK